MTKDIAYVVRLEQKGEEHWLARNVDENCYVAYDFEDASFFANEEDVKDALRQYYSEEHEMKEKERAFVCKVSVKDCACFVKSDIELLLRKSN